MTDRYRDIKQKLCKYAEQDKDIKAVIAIGSSTRSEVPLEIRIYGMMEDFLTVGQTVPYLMNLKTVLHTTTVMIAGVHYWQRTSCLQGWRELLPTIEVSHIPKRQRRVQCHI